MNEEELKKIQELIERKIKLAEVCGGLTASDIKFIDLWNYSVELQERIDKALSYIEDRYDYEQNVLTHTFDRDNIKELYEILKEVISNE